MELEGAGNGARDGRGVPRRERTQLDPAEHLDSGENALVREVMGEYGLAGARRANDADEGPRLEQARESDRFHVASDDVNGDGWQI